MSPAQINSVGVIGAGTMGAGVAQLACLAGYQTFLYELDDRALAAGLERLRSALRRGVERRRWTDAEAEAALERLRSDTILEVLERCDLVIEAAPERLELKRDIFERLARIIRPESVLATNTSSLSVTAIAASVPKPNRMVGMHFFNPPALMKLVEIVAGEESDEESLEHATEVARRMGRTPIRARDAIGFVANRCARPFTLEALRLAGGGVASHEGIDRICRLGGGFRMGPFELMDLIGIDVNFGVARSFHEQSFGEPRWRPHPIQARMAASGRLGRKSGRGFYRYAKDEPHRERDPDVSEPRPIVVDDELLERVAGPLAPRVLGRIGAQLVNEACFALGEGVASGEDIDTAMRLGFNWPIGPLQWGTRMGWARALGILEELRELEGEAYRPAPLLRRHAAGGGEAG
ncbi:MAG: 3-hydroxyacyl-CoA dehydrogenase NAD-binding domain-containing protein [Solirubrobacterales bacterium]